MRAFAIGVVCFATACSATHSSEYGSARTTAQNASVTMSTLAHCSGTLTLPRGGQTVVPVDVPCDCPTDPITPIPETDIARTGPVAAAALRWAKRTHPRWLGAAIQVQAVYVVGVTSQGQFGEVYALNVPKYCGKSVAEASYVVEMWNPTENDTGREADVVVAHFAGGWQVWGAFHP